MHETGPWWDFGDFCWKCFHGLEWTYEHITPNKLFITAAFICFAWWIKMQNDFNKKAVKEVKYK